MFNGIILAGSGSDERCFGCPSANVKYYVNCSGLQGSSSPIEVLRPACVCGKPKLFDNEKVYIREILIALFWKGDQVRKLVEKEKEQAV